MTLKIDDHAKAMAVSDALGKLRRAMQLAGMAGEYNISLASDEMNKLRQVCATLLHVPHPTARKLGTGELELNGIPISERAY